MIKVHKVTLFKGLYFGAYFCGQSSKIHDLTNGIYTNDVTCVIPLHMKATLNTLKEVHAHQGN